MAQIVVAVQAVVEMASPAIRFVDVGRRSAAAAAAAVEKEAAEVAVVERAELLVSVAARK